MIEQSIEDFLTAFNRVHKAICRELNIDDRTEFATAARMYEQQHKSWAHTGDLLVLARLRNVLVHEQRRPKQYLAHPTQTTIETLNRVLLALERPSYVIPRFQRVVEVVGIDDALSEVLPRILRGGYSQFPVYDGAAFKGMLTENGIVRCIAEHRQAVDSIIDLADVSVRILLKQDENRKNYAFASRTERLDAMLDRFVHNPVLEAVLITANGKKDEKLLGIVTQWDALEARGEI